MQAKLERERRKFSDATSAQVKAAVSDPLTWLQRWTCTKDNHWREAGAATPYRPFPAKPYFRHIVNTYQNEPIMLLEKSRDMMVSWIIAGLFTHTVMTVPGIQVLFQSQKEEKSFELVDYAKELYRNQPLWLKEAYPLARSLDEMPNGKLEFRHGGEIIGIPHGADQIRSYHPWGLYNDESAFQPDAGESYDHAISACQKMVFGSSQGPGWFASFTENLE